MLTVVKFERRSRESVVETICKINGMVDDGHIDGIAIAAVWHDGSVTTAFADGRELFPLIGGVDYLKRRLLGQIE